MAQHRLTATQIAKLKSPGLVADGAGLFMQVQEGSDGHPRKSWLVRYTSPSGRRREMGLGSVDMVGLADARARARDARRLAANGIDPIDDRKRKRIAARTPNLVAPSFRNFAEEYWRAHRSSWSNAKVAQQWIRTLEMHAYPHLGDMAVDQIDVSDVLQVLEPIWRTKTETAGRVRSRIEALLDAAAVRGFRSTENPARWRGHLQHALPAPSRVAPTRHFAAMAIDEVPAFMAELLGSSAMAASALAFTILTAARTNEALGAKWSEFDLEQRIWTAPAERMKARRIHRVALSEPAIELLERVAPLRTSADWVFPSPRDANKPLSNMAFLALLKRAGRSDVTAHGFRSSFRDFAAERTNAPREVCEAALAHVVGDQTEAAYRRGDLLEKRRLLMAEWGKFCQQAKND